MAYSVSVTGANNSVLTLNYDQQQIAAKAQNIATAVNNFIAGGGTIDTVSAGLSFATPKTGVPGVLEITRDNSNVQAKGYDKIVDSATGQSTISSSDGVLNKQILFGSGNVNLGANGSGTIVGGDGNNKVNVSGTWNITTGNGNDTISAQGTSTISAGNGRNLIGGLGSSHTVFGGGGSDTLTTGNGDKGFVYYGTDGSFLTDKSNTNDTIIAASGNETLNAVQSTGNVTFDVRSGNSVLTGGLGHDTFSFANDTGGNNVTIFDFTSVDKLNLGNNTIVNETPNGGSLTVTLSDNTVITLSGYLKTSI